MRFLTAIMNGMVWLSTAITLFATGVMFLLSRALMLGIMSPEWWFFLIAVELMIVPFASTVLMKTRQGSRKGGAVTLLAANFILSMVTFFFMKPRNLWLDALVWVGVYALAYAIALVYPAIKKRLPQRKQASPAQVSQARIYTIEQLANGFKRRKGKNRDDMGLR